MIRFRNLIQKIFCFANSAKLLNKLQQMEVSEEVQQFVLSLEPSFQGFAIAAIVKNRNISINEINSIIDVERGKSSLKEKGKSEVLSKIKNLIPNIDSKIEGWAVVQIRKYPEHLNLLNQEYNKIISLVNVYDVNLSSYTIPEAIRYYDSISNLSVKTDNKIDEKISLFLQNSADKLKQKMQTVSNVKLKVWVERQSVKVFQEWFSNIQKYLVKTSKSFDQVISEGSEIYKKMQAGEFRGQELPETPLFNGDYEKLMTKLEELDDWVDAESPDMSIYSVMSAVEASDAWHQRVIEQGRGSKYSVISDSDIVWKSEDGIYFIVELKKENDLRVEGSLMNHCVGGYGDKLKNKQSRIFSLRESSNIYKPILTVETDYSGGIVRQDYGPGNSKVDKKYHDMIDLWNKSQDIEIDFKNLDPDDKIKYVLNLKDSDKLDFFARDEDVSVRSEVAKNEATSLSTLDFLAKDAVYYTREMVAENPNVMLDTLIFLSKDIQPYVRIAVARNVKTPPELLDILSKDNDWGVRSAVARHPNVDVETTLANLAADEESLMSLANNPKITENIFIKVIDTIESMDDENNGTYVYRALIDNPSITEKILDIIVKKSKHRDSLEFVAKNSKTSSNTLNLLAKHNYSPVRAAVAKNPSIPTDAMILLSTDKDSFVRFMLAGNSYIDQVILDNLSEDLVQTVKNQAVQTLKRLDGDLEFMF